MEGLPKSFILVFALLCFFSADAQEFVSKNIVIRQAKDIDFEAILNLNITLAYEYFKPLFINHYSHLTIGKNPDHYLELELNNNIEIFTKCINNPNGNQGLLIAYDTTEKIYAGLILFHKELDELEIDLLLINSRYCTFGLGKKLVTQALATFDDIKSCTVYPIRLGNENILKFYQVIGFANLGIPTIDKKNTYGMDYREMFFYFKMDIKAK